MFDTHCHLTFKEFEGRVGQVLADAAAAGVRGAITIATTTADCLRVQALAAQHATLWHSAGVHPLYSDQSIDWDVFREVACRGPKCVAWGELGLDNHYDRPPRNLQLNVLEEQLAFIARSESESPKEQSTNVQSEVPPQSPNRQIARSPNHLRPIIVHSRDSVDDLLAAFKSAPFLPSRYVFHCFTGGPDDARKVLDFGAWISFTGVVTFQNAPHVAEAAKLVPVDRMLVETDAPFLTPEPMRKIRPNEPKFVVHTARRIAELKAIDPVEFERALDANVERFFGIRL